MSGVIWMGGKFKGRNTNLGVIPFIMKYIQFCSKAKWECSPSTLRHYLWNPCNTDLARLAMVELIAVKLYRTFFTARKVSKQMPMLLKGQLYTIISLFMII